MPETAIKERPILMIGPLVRATLEGRKTVTRRVVKFPKNTDEVFFWDDYPDVLGVNTAFGDAPSEPYQPSDCDKLIRCPYGKPGEHLWVREKWRLSERPFTGDFDADYTAPRQVRYYADDNPRYRDKDKWRPSIHMPRWASRLTLEVTDVSVCRTSRKRMRSRRALTATCALTCSKRRPGRCAPSSSDGLSVTTRSKPTKETSALVAPRLSLNAMKWVDRFGQVRKGAKGYGVCGWDEHFERDSVQWCDKCGVLLNVSLTKYGIERELWLECDSPDDRPRWPVNGSDAHIAWDIASGMGDLRDEHHGRLAQIGFATLWNQLNASNGFSWDANPWVWRIAYRLVEGD